MLHKTHAKPRTIKSILFQVLMVFSSALPLLLALLIFNNLSANEGAKSHLEKKVQSVTTTTFHQASE
jgi:hypothetical protein